MKIILCTKCNKELACQKDYILESGQENPGQYYEVSDYKLDYKIGFIYSFRSDYGIERTWQEQNGIYNWGLRDIKNFPKTDQKKDRTGKYCKEDFKLIFQV